MRTILLWMARNRWLRNRVPRLWFVRRALRRFMPGQEASDALAAADSFQRAGIGTLFTRLGENLVDLAEADEVADHYAGMLDQIHDRGIDGEISIKPTQLGLDLDTERTYQHIARLAGKAAGQGRLLWIDMEGSAYVESTIVLYERLKQDHPNVGIAIQAYLRRTAADVQRLLPLEPAIRLVKGAYAEPATIAYRDRRSVDANFLALAVTMLEASRDRPVRIALGTHDTELIARTAEHAHALGLPKTSFEIQMLYGVREREQRRLAREGFRVLDLIAYGDHWYPWYMRRLAERPANVLFVLRQIVG
jgi:proline dehydrogenase